MLELEAIAPFGAQVHGLKPGISPSDRQSAQLRQALKDHRLLLLRGQPYSEEDHLLLVRAFGTPQRENGYLVNYLNARANEFIKSDEAARERYPFHADYQMLPKGPLRMITLYGVKVDEANPTVFADMVGAETRLPDDLRKWLGKTVNVQLPYHVRPKGDTRFRVSERPAEIPFFKVPSIRTHAETGEHYVCVPESFTSHFEGLSERESDTWFDELAKIQYDPEHLYVHRWREHDLLIFDNEALQHARARVTSTSDRSLRRIVLNPITMDEMLADLSAFSHMYDNGGKLVND